MNNSQFRSLLKGEAGKPQNGSNNHNSSSPSVLGSRHRPAIPLTPRKFSSRTSAYKPLVEQPRATDGERPAKRLKSTNVPKGSKLARGYEDRAASRRDEEAPSKESMDTENMIQALEQRLKAGQIDLDTFAKLKAKIRSGTYTEDTQGTKGLDWELLKKARQNDGSSSLTRAPVVEAELENVDEELDAALTKETASSNRPARSDVESSSPQQSEYTTQVLSRDEILQRWKQQRSALGAVATQQDGSLGKHFKKVANGSSSKKKFIETVNGRRREVLLTTDKAGDPKRKVRWLDPEFTPQSSKAGTQPLGMEIPVEIAAIQQALLQQQRQDEQDDDIFEGVGSNYDPLADIGADSDEDVEKPEMHPIARGSLTDPDHQPSSSLRRNYFASGQERDSQDQGSVSFPNDPMILAALKKAGASRDGDGLHSEGAHPDISDPVERMTKEQQLLEKLRQRDQADAQDLDLGFGENRFGDEDDEDGATWNDGKKSGRKRGPKKKKGDKDDVKDVMSVLAGRQK